LAIGDLVQVVTGALKKDMDSLGLTACGLFAIKISFLMRVVAVAVNLD
jgi:hypothetical protein